MQIRISGLSIDTVSEDLFHLFSTIGTIEMITVISDIFSGRSKGYAIAWIPDSRVALQAIIELNGAVIKGNRITVSQLPETMPREMEFREWLVDNASTVLREIGLREGQTILDYGCGPGTFTISSAEIVGEKGVVHALDIRSQALKHILEKARSAGLAASRPRHGLPVENGHSRRTRPVPNAKCSTTPGVSLDPEVPGVRRHHDVVFLPVREDQPDARHHCVARVQALHLREIILRGEVREAVKANLVYLDRIEAKVAKALESGKGRETMERISIESCGLSRIPLNGLVQQIHLANLLYLYDRMESE